MATVDHTTLRGFVENLEAQLRGGLQGSLEPLGQVLLRLEDKPLTMRDHFPLRPLLATQLPRRLVVKSGRQVGKSTAISASAVLRSWVIPHFKIMIIAPLKSQVINISNTYVKQMINQSIFYEKYVNSQCTIQTLFKEFRNGSRIAFMYASMDASRIRSYTNDMVIIDETQDFDIDQMTERLIGRFKVRRHKRLTLAGNR